MSKRRVSRKVWRKQCRLRRREARDRIRNPEWWALHDWLKEEMFRLYIEELDKVILHGEGKSI